jgi:LysM repeat protein
MQRNKILLAFLVLILLSGSPNLPVSAAPSVSLTCTMYHTVKGGETLESIANKYKVSTGWLALVNGISGDKVQPEHKLCVQLTDTAKVQAACTQVHIVQTGEDLSKIASLYGVTPQWLIAINGLKDPNHIYAGNRICIQTATSSSSGSSGYTNVIPTFSINSVEKNKTVTIQTFNFPANKTFNVLMGNIGTRAINGILSGAVDTHDGGSFVVTFAIPPALKGASQIAIRLESSDNSGYFAYNWFYNRTNP